MWSYNPVLILENRVFNSKETLKINEEIMKKINFQFCDLSLVDEGVLKDNFESEKSPQQPWFQFLLSYVFVFWKC